MIENDVLHPIYKDAEEWKIIPGTNGMYQASSWGKVRSIDRTVNHKTSGKLRLKGRLLKMQETNENYLYITICIEAKRSKQHVHVLVAAAFHGQRPEGYHVDHHDRNRQNNHKENLSYKTVMQNCSFKGSQSGNALLTEKQVSEIKAKYKRRIYTAKMLSDEYLVGTALIHKITAGKNWKHVQPAKLAV